MDFFQGFGIPEENWSKLPHCFIEALPLVETLAEMKVILYVLRHTWGYQDDEKRISIDEFVNGRKYTKRYQEEHPEKGGRIDSGVGMCENSVRDGIDRAIKHGFIEVWEDDSDKARIKRYYNLNLGAQSLNPSTQKLNPRPSKVEPRTKKETIETNQEKELGANAPSEPLAPIGAPYAETSITEGDLELDCPSCGDSIVIRNLKRNQAVCPHCNIGLYISDADDVIQFKPPQSLRPVTTIKRVLSDLMPCPPEWANFPYYARDKAAFDLLYKTARDDLVSGLTWAIGEYAKGQMKFDAVVSSAIKGTQKRLAVTKPAQTSQPLDVVDELKKAGYTDAQIEAMKQWSR